MGTYWSSLQEARVTPLTVVVIVVAMLVVQDHIRVFHLGVADRWATLVTTSCSTCLAEHKHLMDHANDPENPVKIFSVGNPLFNVREIAKQAVLLEQHLEEPHLRCCDCIRKHFLTIEGLFEEAVGLDRYGKHSSLLNGKSDAIRGIIQEFNETHQHLKAAQKIRDIRKECVNATFESI